MMTTPTIYTYPVKRPGFITSASWAGNPGDPHPELDIFYTSAGGTTASVPLLTRDHPDGFMCLPTTANINDLSEDLLVAHIRMAGMISGTIPGSDEYADALVATDLVNSKFFQTPIGDVKVISITSVSDSYLAVEFQKGSATSRTLQVPIADLASYTFAPSTQLLCIAGAVKKQYPTYVQDPATNKYLTQTQMNNIANYIMTLEPWI